MRTLKNINDINGDTIEGRLLLIAIGELEALGQTDVLETLNQTNKAFINLGL